MEESEWLRESLSENESTGSGGEERRMRSRRTKEDRRRRSRRSEEGRRRRSGEGEESCPDLNLEVMTALIKRRGSGGYNSPGTTLKVSAKIPAGLMFHTGYL